MLYSPLEQFKIAIKLDFLFKYLDLSISLIDILLFIIIFIFYFLLSSDIRVLPNKINLFFINFYNFINKEFYNLLNIKLTSYLPLVMISFFYILLVNLLGLIPYSFTLTSQIIITVLWSSIIMITVTYLGIKKHGFKFLNLFIPNGIPIYLAPFLFIIELISYISRVLSLAIRLSANMIAGHVLIYIITLFGLKFLLPIQIAIVLPTIIAFLFLEIAISFIQAYVFTLLMSAYIKDSIELSH